MRTFLHRLLTRLLGWARRDRARDLVPHVGADETVGRPRAGRLFADPRDQLDANEFFEAEQSRTEYGLHVTDIAEDMVQARRIRGLTQDGFVTVEEVSLLRTAYGRLVTPKELVGGGQCAVCGGYADAAHFFLCAACGCGLCVAHGVVLDGVVVCPEHAKRALDYQDTWRRNRP